MLITLKILGLIAAWILFYNILKLRQKRFPGTKALIITLLFASLIFRLGSNLYTHLT